VKRVYLIAGTAFAAIAVILGAFGAHALKAKLQPDMLQVFETGVRYQMYHSLALILTGILSGTFKTNSIKYAGNFFIAGIILFSGSLYMLSTKEIIGGGSLNFLGPVTPLGGLCFLCGWSILLYTLVKNKQS
jgi:uncharacterized membrane protein YgdD (TMEM256/DUF423 family)